MVAVVAKLVHGRFARIRMGEDGHPVAVQRQICGYRRKHHVREY